MEQNGSIISKNNPQVRKGEEKISHVLCQKCYSKAVARVSLSLNHPAGNAEHLPDGRGRWTMADVPSVTCEELPGLIMIQRPVSVLSVTPVNRPGTEVDNDVHRNIRTGITCQV